jgi:hypothetical protein
MHSQWLRSCIVVLCTVVGASGCANVKNVATPTSWAKSDPQAPQEPRRVTAIWSETALHQSGRPSVRGFGGRLLFYGTDPERPVKVDGKLVVYAFDESQTQSPKGGDVPVRLDGTATKKYEFTKEQVPTHYSESSIGPSYSFWVPWDDIGGEQKEVTLIPYFISASGAVIAGEPTRNVLQGKTPQIQPAEVQSFTRGNIQPVQQVGYESQETARRQMDTTTINISPNLAKTMGPVPMVAPPMLTQPPAQGHAAGVATGPTMTPATAPVAPTTTTAATTPGAPTAFRLPPRARFELDRSPAPSEQAAQPDPGHGSWELYRGGSRPAPPSARPRPFHPAAAPSDSLDHSHGR